MTGTLYGIGVGPGDPELVTLKAARILGETKVVAYIAANNGDSFARAIVKDMIPQDAEELAIVIPMRSSYEIPHEIYDRAASTIATYLRDNQNVSVLCEGDPFFYGSFMYLSGRLGEDFSVEIIPGVSSLNACAAALKIPLAARLDVFTVLPAVLPKERLRAQLEATDCAAIIKLGRNFGKIRGLIEEMGLTGNAHYIEHATLATQSLMPVAGMSQTTAPYFSMILVHKKEQPWKR